MIRLVAASVALALTGCAAPDRLPADTFGWGVNLDDPEQRDGFLRERCGKPYTNFVIAGVEYQCSPPAEGATP